MADPESPHLGVLPPLDDLDHGPGDERHPRQASEAVGDGIVDAYDDGRYDIEVIGRQRLRVIESDSSGPFLRGEVELLPDTDEPDAVAEAEGALATFETYRDRLFTEIFPGRPLL
mgnify:CR=1 FL=1